MTMRQLFSFTATLILAAASQAQTTVNLRPRFHAGEETRYTLTQDADSRTVSGQRPAAPQAPGPNRPARKHALCAAQHIQLVAFRIDLQEIDSGQLLLVTKRINCRDRNVPGLSRPAMRLLNDGFV